MNTDREASRRQFLKGSAAAGLLAAASPLLWRQAAVAGTSPPAQLHLQFGSDPATDMTVSWATPAPVACPRLRLGTPTGGYGSTLGAVTRTYTDHATGREVFTHHVPVSGLAPGSRYVYQVLHDGSAPVAGSFTTAPRGRAPFRFTSFGDQGTGDPTYRLSTPYGAYVVDQVEARRPLFHLLNGDLAYGDLQADPAGAWDAFFANNMRSARFRPWMPAVGNHENETGNGPQGFASYVTRFWLPPNGSADFAGYWYAFTVGSVRFVVLQNDDACYQNGGNFDIRGYSDGAQRRWLDATLAAARSDPAVDWVVVCMHQLVMSSGQANGSDLGLRQQWAPLFDRHGVDLVLAGHDHDYERTYAVRGVDRSSATLRPRVTSTALDVVDATAGAVHLVLGGGGSVPTNVYGPPPAGGPPIARVITGPATTAAEFEAATWSAVRDPAYGFGFASIDVDPGDRPGGPTTLRVEYYRTAPGPGSEPQIQDRFTLRRARRDGPTRPA